LRKSVLGDICEAVIGAVFLDGGYPAAARAVMASAPIRFPHDRLWWLWRSPARPLGCARMSAAADMIVA